MAEQITLAQLAGRAVTDPRAAFHHVQSMGLERRAMWQILVLLAIGRVLLIGLFDGARFIIPFGTTPIVVSPFAYTMVLIAGFLVMIFMVHYTGRLMGGTGTLPGAMVVGILLEALAFALVVIQIVVGFVLPGIVGILGLISLPVMLYCALSYIDELHSFGSMLKAFGMIVLSVVGLSLGITILLTLLGVGAGMQGV
jgi:hypothetical protein